MENPKSLLELLKDEDKLKYDVKFNSETYEMLKFKEKHCMIHWKKLCPNERTISRMEGDKNERLKN